MDTLQEVINEIRENNNKRTKEKCVELMEHVKEKITYEPDECVIVHIYCRKWKDFTVSKSNVAKTRTNKSDYDELYLSDIITNSQWTNIDDT